MPTVYITAPRDAAGEIARVLVEARLAACVNVVPCESTYWWKGEVHEDEEAILFAKTTEAAYEDLVDRLTEVHPYDVPCVERFDEDTLLPAFAAWRRDAVT